MVASKSQQHTFGAYLRHGFHEDGLLSAVEIAKQFGIDAPWAAQLPAALAR